MFLKLCLVIVAIGGTGVGSLSMRQSRLIAVHEATQARLRVQSLERKTTALRARLALETTPEQIRARLNPEQTLRPETHGRADLLRSLEASIGATPETWTLDDGTLVELEPLVPVDGRP